MLAAVSAADPAQERGRSPMLHSEHQLRASLRILHTRRRKSASGAVAMSLARQDSSINLLWCCRDRRETSSGCTGAFLTASAAARAPGAKSLRPNSIGHCAGAPSKPPGRTPLVAPCHAPLNPNPV
jgi:hypothetical protein